MSTLECIGTNRSVGLFKGDNDYYLTGLAANDSLWLYRWIGEGTPDLNILSYDQNNRDVSKWSTTAHMSLTKDLLQLPEDDLDHELLEILNGCFATMSKIIAGEIQ